MNKENNCSKTIKIISIILVIILMVVTFTSPLIVFIADLIAGNRYIYLEDILTIILKVLTLIPLILLLICCLKKDKLKFTKQLGFGIGMITVHFLSICLTIFNTIFMNLRYQLQFTSSYYVNLVINIIIPIIEILFFVTLILQSTGKPSKTKNIIFIIFLVLVYLLSIRGLIATIITNRDFYTNFVRIIYTLTGLLNALTAFNIPIIETLLFIDYQKK